MTSLALVRILDTVRVHCPGAMDGMMRLELSNVLKEFYNRSNIWTMELPFYATHLINDYQLCTGVNGSVIRLMYLDRPTYPPDNPPVYLPGDPPQFLQLQQGGTAPNQNVDLLYRSPREGFLLNVGKSPLLRLRYPPAQDETWIVTVAMNIADPLNQDGLACSPDWIVDKYFNYITDGVVSRLMIQPAKPYSSEKGAAYHGRKFNEGVGLARTEVRAKFSYDSQRWQFPQTFNIRRSRWSA